MNRKLLIVLLIAGVILLVAAGALFAVLSPTGLTLPFAAAPTPTLPPLPTFEITPPASLADLAEEYPELADILTDPELDSVYKEFLMAYQDGGEEAAMELARKRGLLTPDENIRVNLVLDTEEYAPLVDQLEAAGVVVVSAYRDQVNVAIPLALVEAQLETEEPGAIFDQLTELDHVIRVRLPQQNIPDGSDIDGEGIGIVGADTWHSAGFTGAGLRIGVLDLGFAGYQSLLGAELPDQVTLERFGWIDENEVHGAACAEIIHEIAPDAELFFAWYDGTDAAMGEAVDWLMQHDVDIISHSAGGLVGPRDGSEWDARLVDDLAGRGVLWVNSAGNEGLAHYRGIFTDQDGDGFHEFAPGEEIMPLYNSGGVLVFLTWEDNWGQAEQDYELFLYDGAGNKLAASQEAQEGEVGQEPAEGIMYDTGGDTVYAVVSAYDVDQAVTLDIFTDSGTEVGYPSPAYSVCPPGDAVGALTVGAVNWWDDSLADYSSQGPTSDGRLKPEVSAPAGVSGATYGPNGFDGTSASCPHVAGTAALVWQAYPQFSRQEVMDYILNNAVDLGAAGPDTGFGYGRLQLGSPPSETQPAPTNTPPSPGATPTEGGPPPTRESLPTPTTVTYATPLPVPPGTKMPGTMTVTGIVLLTGGIGCAGIGLLLIAIIGLIIIRRRTSRPPRPRRPSARPRPPQAARCRYCGAPLRPGSRFCNNCGKPVQ